MIRYLALTLACLTILAGCDRSDPESRLRDTIARGEQVIEDRVFGDLREFIAPTYRDREGRSQRDLVRLVSGYLLRHKSIHLLVQIERLQLGNDAQADVVLWVAVAGRPITGAEALPSLRADLLRLDLKFEEEAGNWRVTRGQWRRARAEDFRS